MIREVSTQDYPLALHHADDVLTSTGRHLSEVTLEAAMAGNLSPEDLRIAPSTLTAQAQIAESAGRRQLGDNFRRAAELATISDDRVLSMYNSLRPKASTKTELTAIAEELEVQHAAPLCGALFREAAEVYEQRGILADSSVPHATEENQG